MSGEMQTPKAPTLKEYLNKHVKSLESVAASTITPDKMIRLVCAATMRQPDLAQCTGISILNAMMQAATYGLGVCDGSNDAYLVPYNCKVKKDGRDTWEKQAQFIPGYQGLIKKAIESQKVRNIESRVVYENDSFEYEYGLKPACTHRPKLGKDRGKVVAFYAVAFLPDDSTQFEVMNIDEVNAIKTRSKSGDKGPWITDFNEMGRKTVVRRLYKYIPKSATMAALLEIQAKAESGDFLEGEILRPGEAILPELPGKVINEDGETEWIWTEEERKNSEALLGDYMESIASSNVPMPAVDEIFADYRMKIGVPDLSPEKWANRLQGACDRAIEKAKKTS